MSFASAIPTPRYPLTTDDIKTDDIIAGNDGYPDILLSASRVVMRLSGEVTNARLRESLENALDHIQSELFDWHIAKGDEALSVREKRLYLRAVYFYAKAELIERYRDFDLTGSGERRADSYDDAVDESRRNCRWAISDLLGVPRVTIEVM